MIPSISRFYLCKHWLLPLLIANPVHRHSRLLDLLLDLQRLLLHLYFLLLLLSRGLSIRITRVLLGVDLALRL
jgi:hypothetical protein